MGAWIQTQRLIAGHEVNSGPSIAPFGVGSRLRRRAVGRGDGWPKGLVGLEGQERTSANGS